MIIIAESLGGSYYIGQVNGIQANMTDKNYDADYVKNGYKAMLMWLKYNQ